MSHILGQDVIEDQVIASRTSHPELEMKFTDVALIYTFAHSPFVFLQKKDKDANAELYFTLFTSNAKNNCWNLFCDRSQKISNLTDFSKMSFVARNNVLYALTTRGNNLGRIIKLKLINPDFENPEVILEAKDGWKVESLSDGEDEDSIQIHLSKNNAEFKNVKYLLSSKELITVGSSESSETKGMNEMPGINLFTKR